MCRHGNGRVVGVAGGGHRSAWVCARGPRLLLLDLHLRLRGARDLPLLLRPLGGAQETELPRGPGWRLRRQPPGDRGALRGGVPRLRRGLRAALHGELGQRRAWAPPAAGLGHGRAAGRGGLLLPQVHGILADLPAAHRLVPGRGSGMEPARGRGRRVGAAARAGGAVPEAPALQRARGRGVWPSGRHPGRPDQAGDGAHGHDLHGHERCRLPCGLLRAAGEGCWRCPSRPRFCRGPHGRRHGALTIEAVAVVRPGLAELPRRPLSNRSRAWPSGCREALSVL
mmetsp:Transcript_30062/g.93716  ORF Transcript_30062/g.93716 Transcript_30062/m.93716 type:complete len:283 (+) Transcript_30062:840-1688(+)